LADSQPERAASWRRRACQWLRQLEADADDMRPARLWSEHDFEALRGEPAFRQLLVDWRLDLRYCGTWTHHPTRESRSLLDQSLEQHQQASRRLLDDGFAPVAQFRQFLEDPRVRESYREDPFGFTESFAPEPDCPQISTAWFDAAR
jgi:hypothetical protein